MEKVRLGFIGSGLCARDLHWPALSKLTDKFVVTNASSRNEQKARDFAGLTGSESFTTDHRELLADKNVDAVVINYPFDMNYQLTQEALQAGKHVIVEKPMAANMQEAAAMIELEKNTPLVTMVAENYRYRKSIRLAKQYIEDGKIGQPAAIISTFLNHFERDAKWLTQSNWRLNCVGGVMLDRDVHWCAMLRELFGDVRHAIGHQAKIRQDIGPVDQVSLHMIFENGATGTFTDIASITGYACNDFKIIGSEGTIIIDEFTTVTLTSGDGKREVTEYPEGDGRGYIEEFEDFHKAITTGTKPRSSFLEGYKDLQLGMTALQTNAEWDRLELVK